VVVFRSTPLRSANLVVITLSLALGGCHAAGGGQQTAPSASSTTSSPSPAPSALAAADAVTAYRGMWTAVVAAATVPDPDAPDLRRYASGDALKLLVGNLVIDRDQGKVVKGDVDLSPTVTALEPAEHPTQVTITDCVDATNWLEYKKSGDLWNKEPGAKHHNTAILKLTDGVWKVSSFTLEKGGTC
jgi:hypothetical protein